MRPSQKLSRYLAFVLRHRPDTLDLSLDSGGWVALDVLLHRVNECQRFRQSVDRKDVEALVRSDRRCRFAIRGEKIRATGGHTVPGVEVRYPDAKPPNLLYFGTVKGRREVIAKSGSLEPRKWSYLQLSATPEPASRVASRINQRDAHVVVIEAQRAARSGVPFFRAPSGLYLARSIPFAFLLTEQPNFNLQQSSGGVLCRGQGDRSEILLIRAERHGRPMWEIAKGKVEPAETVEDAAIREFCEETGVSVSPSAVRIKAPLREIRYAFRTENLCFLKTVHFFLLDCDETDLSFNPRAEERIYDCQWFTLDKAVELVAFRNLRPIIHAARAILQPGSRRQPRRSGERRSSDRRKALPG